MRSLPGWIIALLLAAVCGCSKSHDHGATPRMGHAHRAIYGGTLVEVGEHQYNLEVVHDRAAGTLTVYVLDGHAEQFIRLPLGALDLKAVVEGTSHLLRLTAVANAATGETVGDTSQFSGQADWLKTADRFEATVPELEIRGTKFTGIRFAIAAP